MAKVQRQREEMEAQRRAALGLAPEPEAPAQPTVPGAAGPPSTTDATPTSVTLEWAAVPAGGDGGSAVTGHKLEFDRGDGRGLCHVYGGAEARFTVAGLVPGTSYSTRVCAENEHGDTTSCEHEGSCVCRGE